MKAVSKYSNNIFSSFTKKYPLSKTLRFELKPLDGTKKQLKGFIESDQERAENYKELKKIIDEYHKDYIEKSLSKNNILQSDDLKSLKEKIKKSGNIQLSEEKQKNEKSIERLQEKLRKQIVKAFKDKKGLFDKQLIKSILPEWLDNSSLENVEHKKEIVEKFQQFTTYLTGFHENRKNMYSDKEQTTAISYRIINENLPKFLSNLSTYEKITKNFSDLKSSFKPLKKQLKAEFEYFEIQNIEDLFTVELFNKCLTQTGIDNYNTIMGGKVLEGGVKVQGINEKINLFRQAQNKIDKDKVRKISNRNLPVMQTLYKQILSDRESHSFYFEEFKNRQEVLKNIDEYWRSIFKKEPNQMLSVLQRVEILFKELKKYELDGIYFKNSELSNISNKIFKDHSIIKSALHFYAENQLSTKKEKEQYMKKDFFSFQEIQTALSEYVKEHEVQVSKHFSGLIESGKNQSNILVAYFDWEFSKKYNNKNLLSVLEELYNDFKKIPSQIQSEFDEKEIQIIQNFLKPFDKEKKGIMDLLQIIRSVYLEKDRKKIMDLEKDTSFYNEFEELYEMLSPVFGLYNKVRNYATKTKHRMEKIKINFEDSTLLAGWDINKESDNLAVVLRKKDALIGWRYYLGVMNKNNSKGANKIFDYHIKNDESEKKQQEKKKLKQAIFHKENNENFYEKMNYKLLPDPSKMLPKVFFSKKNISFFNPSKEISKIKEKKTYAKSDGDAFSLNDCHKLIDFYKASIKKHEEWGAIFDFKFSSTGKYEDISDFFAEVSDQGYKLSFDRLKASYIEDKVKTGEFLLFEVYSKDFSVVVKRESKPNLHTSYFKQLFEEKNLEDIVYKLNGQAEIFYRKASKQKKISHKANEPIKNKNPDNPKKTSKFKYNLIKDRRFTEDKYFFHVPIDLNFKARKKGFNFNQDVLQVLKGNKSVNIIGIDRGERHLAYYTVIDQSGTILKQGSFNKITTNYKKQGQESGEIKTNYHDLLESKEKERDNSRKAWTKIENIKELKSGYLSHLVHEISHLMIKHNAIVIFEDLNKGFKRGRMKFEKQIYQKLEKALIDKLNYLVFKDKKHEEAGGLLNAYQLTAPFESFKKLGKQTGFIFYTPAYYTSKVCPLTGFVNLIYPKYENITKSKGYFKSFERIYFENKKEYFIFEYQDGEVNPSRKSESDTLWRVCTHGERRYKYNHIKRKHEKYNVTQELKELFKEYGINYEEKKDLKESIGKQDKKDFFIRLTEALCLTLQQRHINPDEEDVDKKDFILSPVADSEGRFFDSKLAKDNEPKNADANGAYHIALKGLKMLEDIKTNKKQQLSLSSLKNKDWFKFIRTKPFLFNGKKKLVDCHRVLFVERQNAGC